MPDDTDETTEPPVFYSAQDVLDYRERVRREAFEECAKIAEAEAEKAMELMRAFDADDRDLNYHEWNLAADAADAIAAAIRKGG